MRLAKMTNPRHTVAPLYPVLQSPLILRRLPTAYEIDLTLCYGDRIDSGLVAVGHRR